MSSVGEDMTGRRTASSSSLLGWSGLLALVAFSVFRMPPWLPLFVHESNGVDPSWQMLLNEAVSNDWVFGRDLFFTYGPFGFIHARMYHPETWAVVIAAWVGISMIMADLVWRVTGHGRLTTTWRTLCGIAMLEFMSRDAMAVCFTLHAFVFIEAALLQRNAATSRLSDATSPSIVKTHPAFASSRLCVKSFVELCQRFRLVLPMLLLAALPWAKFSYFVTVAFLGCTIVVVAALQRRFPWRAALLFTACPLAWLMTGGSLAECREFIGTGFQLAGGYSSAMGLAPDSVAGTIVVISAAAVVLLLPVWLISRLPHSDWRLRVVTMLFFLGLLFIAWKSCFVRYHAERVPVFLGTVIPLLAYGAIVGRRRDSVETSADINPQLECATGSASADYSVTRIPQKHWQSQWHTLLNVLRVADRSFVRPLLLTAVVLVVSAGYFERGQLSSVAEFVDSEVGPVRDQLSAVALSVKKPAWRKGIHDEQLQKIRIANPIPKLDGTVDVFPSKLAVAFAHGLRLRPRPVLQSYAAFTPALIDRDARHFRGPSAPDHVLISVGAIDSRLPTMEDSKTWLELLSHYELTGSSSAFLKLSLRAQPSLLLDDEPAFRKTVRWNDVVEVPIDLAGPVWCRISIKPSLPGRLASILYRLPAVHLTTQAGHHRSNDHTFRLLPGSAEAGFLISPRVETTDDLRRLWHSAAESNLHDVHSENRVTGFSCAFAEQSGCELLFAPDVTVELFRLFRDDRSPHDSFPTTDVVTLR
jgi:hypothetical protein